MMITKAARILAIFAACFLALAPAQASRLESGVAITDPETLTFLEDHGLSLADLVTDAAQAEEAKTDNSVLFGLYALSPIRRFVKEQIAELPSRSLEPLVRGLTPAQRRQQTFNPAFFDDRGSRLVLTGIVNRMDRGFLTQTRCGEIRLIYRFHYTVRQPKKPELSSRLPLTLSLVFDARPRKFNISCATVARRWLASGDKAVPPEEMAAWLRSDEGPLSPLVLDKSQILRIELNMQVVRLTASTKKDFGGHAEYLMKVFRFDQSLKRPIFQEARLENQVDRDKLLADPKLLEALRAAVLSDRALYDLDRGRLVIDTRFLADRAVSVAPGGLSRSQNNAFLGLIEDADIAKALEAYGRKGKTLETIKSVDGFKARLNDLTCTGCHQTHAIAGFHFTGADTVEEPARNAVFVPGSAHFFADLPRRRAIVEAFAAVKTPDLSRPFAGRPDIRFKDTFKGTALYDGWGSICYSGSDPSFTGWSCGKGLKCAALHASALHPGFGTCIGATGRHVGDPVEFGRVEMSEFGSDRYCRTGPKVFKDCAITPGRDPVPKLPDRAYIAARQRYDDPANKTGGFPAGMLRLRNCDKLPDEATCGRVARDGFNACVRRGEDHKFCTLNFTAPAGLRACDKENPCREDYICTARYDDLAQAKPGKGTCIPPYFVFQFRVDGHPSTWLTP